MIGTNINEYFNAAMKYPIERLTAVMQGKDNSLPQAAAMMALQIKKPMIDAMKGKQAQAQPPQPSVKDQMEQDITMLPENIGIGQLPAPNMERMADGGITGYADGGIVAFAGGDLVNAFAPPTGDAESQRTLALMREAEIRAQQQQDARKKMIMDKIARNEPLTAAEQAIATRTQMPVKALATAASANAPVVENIAPVSGEPSVSDKLRAVHGDKALGPYDPNVPIPREGIDAYMRLKNIDPAQLDKPVSKKNKAQKRADSTAGAGDAGLGQLADRQAAVTGDTSLSGAYTMAKGMGAEEEAANKRSLQDFETESIRALEDQRVAREAGRPTGKPYENLERSLSRETEAAAGKEEKNLKMAIINAGLAMMGGKSQYAMQNIAEGAQVGTKQYQAGIDKLETAAKDREKMGAMIEESRRAEARGDWKDKADYDQKVTEAKLGLKKNSIDAIVKLTGENKKNATEIWKQQSDLVKSDKEMASRERIADKQVAGGITQAGIYAGARGASTDPYNVAYDNATSRLKAEVLADPMLKARMASDPDLAQRMFNQYLQEALNKKPGAGGGGGPAAVTGKTKSGATTSGWQ